MIDNQSIASTPFETLFHNWNRKVYHYALLKTSSTYIAEETVQRVFIKLWKNLNNKQLEIKIEAQIFCITRSILLDIIKEEHRHRAIIPSPYLSDVQTSTPMEIYRLKEIEKHLEHVIEQMPKTRKQIFLLSRFENLSYKEIAHRLAISPKTVENHISLALRTIKKNFLLIFLFFYIFFWG